MVPKLVVAGSIPVSRSPSSPLTALVSGLFPLTGQALIATASASFNFSAAIAILSTIDCNVRDLAVVGTSVGTNEQATKSLVPVALRASASVCEPAPNHPRRSAARSARSGSVDPFRRRHSGPSAEKLCQGAPTNRDRGKLLLSQVRQHNRLVHQGPFTIEPFQPPTVLVP